MKRVIIIQARVGSTRLPGKVLLDLAGRPMLAQQLRRIKRCRMADEIVIATTTNKDDDSIVDLSNTEGVRWFRGSEQDVLSRYIGAARDSKADIVVRINADCPLIDPEQTDRVVRELQNYPDFYDYAGNFVVRTFPFGLDTEAMFKDTLERIGRLSKTPLAIEHVTIFLLKERPDLFIIRSVTDNENNSDLRWTVDTHEDLELVRRIYERLNLNQNILPYRSILDYVRKHPELIEMNAHIKQKTL